MFFSGKLGATFSVWKSSGELLCALALSISFIAEQELFPPQTPQRSNVFPLLAIPSQPVHVELSPKHDPQASLFSFEPPHTPQSSKEVELPKIPSQPMSNSSFAPGSWIRIVRNNGQELPAPTSRGASWVYSTSVMSEPNKRYGDPNKRYGQT